jgi:hypothetical protein
VALVTHGLIPGLFYFWLSPGLVPDRVVAASLVLDLANKKGPEEAPTRTARIWMTSAIPGGAPGYDNDKEFGNNLAHASV